MLAFDLLLILRNLGKGTPSLFSVWIIWSYMMIKTVICALSCMFDDIPFLC
jgi:hypothetical protein